jgi:molybdate transport system substrate-binding protein
MILISRRNLAGTAALALTCALFAIAPVRGAEIKVVTSRAFEAAYLELVPEYERTTHYRLVTEFGSSMGTTHNAIPLRLERSEAIDVVIMAVPALEDLINQGRVRADTRVDLAQSRSEWP